MLKFKYGGGDGGGTLMGIGITYGELLDLLAGKSLNVTQCPVSEIPNMLIIAGATDDEIQAQIEKTLVSS